MFNGESGAQAEVQGSKIQQMRALRQASCVHEEVSSVPYLFQGAGDNGSDPWRHEGQLVKEGKHESIGSNCGHAPAD